MIKETNDSTANNTLTDREISVLKFISNGFEDKAIAVQMNISVHTVRAFVHKIIVKMQAKNRVHAACNAIRQGIID